MRRRAVFLAPGARAPRFALLVLLALFVLFATGCANRGLVRYEKLAKQAASQDYLDAARAIKEGRSSLYGSQSDLLYNMDLGLVYHYAGRYDSSIVHFARAADIHDALFTRSVTNEAASLLVNDNVRPYRGRPHEIVWLRVFQAFNYLALGDLDGARVEMRQAQILVNEFARKAGGDKDAWRDDELFRGVAALIYDALGEGDDAAISIYHAVRIRRAAKQPVPPDMTALACRLLGAADRPDDIRLLELDCPPRASRPRGDTGTVVVIGALGRTPALGETVFWGTWVRDGILVYHYRDANGKTVTDALPAPGLPPSEAAKAGSGRATRSGTTLSIKWAMPSLRNTPYRSRSLRVADTAAGTVGGEVWADAADEMEADIERNRTAVLLRTVTRVVVRTLATERAKAEVRTDNPLLNLLTNLGADFLSGQLEQADVRSWFLLPRTVQVATLRVPAGVRELQLGALDGDGRTVLTEARQVEVRPGGTTFVFFNSLK